MKLSFSQELYGLTDMLLVLLLITALAASICQTRMLDKFDHILKGIQGEHRQGQDLVQRRRSAGAILNHDSSNPIFFSGADKIVRASDYFFLKTTYAHSGRQVRRRHDDTMSSFDSFVCN